MSNSLMTGQRSLGNFLDSVAFVNPDLAEKLRPDCLAVSLHALAADKTAGKEAADRLRRAAFDLPPVLERVLCGALLDLGF